MTKYGIGLGPASYKGILTNLVSEIIAARGGGGDVAEIVAQLLYRHGFDSFFDANDQIRGDEVRAALMELLPPAPADPKIAAAERLAQARADNFGCGAGPEGLAKFNALHPTERLRRMDAAAHVQTPTPTAADWYGFKTESAFMALNPTERLKLIRAAEAPVKTAFARVQMPADAHTWRPEDRLTYGYCRNDGERDEMAAKARGNAEADKATREQTNKQIAEASNRVRNA